MILICFSSCASCGDKNTHREREREKRRQINESKKSKTRNQDTPTSHQGSGVRLINFSTRQEDGAFALRCVVASLSALFIIVIINFQSDIVPSKRCVHGTGSGYQLVIRDWKTSGRFSNKEWPGNFNPVWWSGLKENGHQSVVLTSNFKTRGVPR